MIPNNDSRRPNANKTIALGIPTYNRPESLLRRLREAREFPEICEIIVCDNSDVTDARVAAEVAANRQVTYRRNSANLGGGANFLRLIEHATSDYMWWRGDDDPITRAQVEAVASSTQEEACLIILNHNVQTGYAGQGIEDFCHDFAKTQAMGWLTMIVLPTAVARRSLRWGYWGVATGWANVCLVLGLFREEPNLKYKIVPFNFSDGDFREIGRSEGLPWAFFKTCIEQFPKTGELIADCLHRKIYLAEWRKTQSFRLCLTMVRLKVGLLRDEKITGKTLSPLLCWNDPRSCLLSVSLFFVYFLPVFVLRIAVSWWVGRCTTGKLNALGLEWLANKSFVARIDELNKRGRAAQASGFL